MNCDLISRSESISSDQTAAVVIWHCRWGVNVLHTVSTRQPWKAPRCRATHALNRTMQRRVCLSAVCLWCVVCVCEGGGGGGDDSFAMAKINSSFGPCVWWAGGERGHRHAFGAVGEKTISSDAAAATAARAAVLPQWALCNHSQHWWVVLFLIF